jgi:hypothetical protein
MCHQHACMYVCIYVCMFLYVYACILKSPCVTNREQSITHPRPGSLLPCSLNTHTFIHTHTHTHIIRTHTDTPADKRAHTHTHISMCHQQRAINHTPIPKNHCTISLYTCTRPYTRTTHTHITRTHTDTRAHGHNAYKHIYIHTYIH